MSKFDHTIDYIREIFGKDKFIPLHEPRFWGNEKKYLNEAIDSTFVSSVGEYVNRFEAMMAAQTMTNKAVAVVNGTAGIQVALRLVGVARDTEVITQALTFIATVNAIVYNGADPVFIDVDLDTMGLSPKAVEQFLEENGDLRDDGCYNKKTGKRIAACLPMHTFGFPVHLDELIAVCEKWNIPLVEDAAESLGSQYKDKPTGSFGKMGVISFNGNKIVTTGGGGAIVTNNMELGVKAKHLTNTSKLPHPYEYTHDEVGFNFRMPNINAALGCAQLEQLNDFLENKRALASLYEQFFKRIGIKFRTDLPESKSNYWLMCIELENMPERNLFLETTAKQQVMTRPIWTLMFKLPMYEYCQRDEQKNARFLEERIVNIPSSAIYIS